MTCGKPCVNMLRVLNVINREGSNKWSAEWREKKERKERKGKGMREMKERKERKKKKRERKEGRNERRKGTETNVAQGAEPGHKGP